MIYLKIETRSLAKINGNDAVGVWNYSLDKTTQINCISYLYNGIVKNIGENQLDEDNQLKDLIKTKLNLIACPNSFFYYSIYKNILEKHYNFPHLDHRDFHCLLSKINANNIPRAIKQAANFLGINSDITFPEKKAASLCFLGDRIFSEDEYNLLKSYSDKIVQSLEKIDNELYTDESNEWRTKSLDLKINVKGIHIDVNLIRKALKLYKALVIEKKDQVKNLTNNELLNVTSRKNVLSWLKKYKIYIPDFSKDYLEQYIENTELPKIVKQILKLRIDLGSNSIAKYIKMLKIVSVDDRIRGLLTYCGTVSGRWSSYDVQLQNLPRCDNYNTNELANNILNCNVEQFKDKYQNPLDALKCSIRGSICAPEGFNLLGGDYTSIEFRVLMCLCGDTETLEKIKRGDDIYLEMTEKIFNLSDKTKVKNWQKQIGKIVTLSIGYGLTDAGLLNKLLKINEFKKNIFNEKDVIASLLFCHSIIKTYFENMKFVKKFWHDIISAAKLAIQSNEKIDCGYLLMYKFNNNLHIRLPSRRVIIYNNVRLNESNGVISYSFKGEAEELTDKILCCHLCQGVARDILANGMLNLDKNDFDIILTTHDEVVCETNYKTIQELKFLMEQPPVWLPQIPLHVKTWENYRYMK